MGSRPLPTSQVGRAAILQHFFLRIPVSDAALYVLADRRIRRGVGSFGREWGVSSFAYPRRFAAAPAVRGVTIAEVSQTLGVPMPTLRSWELRYGIPASDRQVGRHRRYTPQELQALRLMRDEVARGTRASVAARTVQALLEPQAPAGALIDQFLAGTAQLNPDPIRAALDQAAGDFGLGRCIDEVMLPALRRAGTWWAVGACDAEPEKLAVRVIRDWLGRRRVYAPTADQPRGVLLVGGPDDVHSVGAEALALLLRTGGWRCRLLTTHTRTDQLSIVAQNLQPDAVVVVSNLVTGRRSATASINVVHRGGYRTYYAGSAFAAPATRRTIPGTYLGNSITDAAHTILASHSTS